MAGREKDTDPGLETKAKVCPISKAEEEEVDLHVLQVDLKAKKQKKKDDHGKIRGVNYIFLIVNSRHKNPLPFQFQKKRV